MKASPRRANPAAANRRQERPRTTCRSAGAYSGRWSWCCSYCAVRPWMPCRGRATVPAHELERWQRIFLEQGKRGLRTKAEPEERELILARAKIGELMMRLELAEDLIEKRGFTDEWKRRRG